MASSAVCDAELASLSGPELVQRLRTSYRREDYKAAARVLNARDRALAEAKEGLDARNDRLAEVEVALAETKEDLDECDRELATAKEALDARDRKLAEAEAALADVKEALGARDLKLSDAKEALDARDRKLADANEGLDARGRKLAKTEAELVTVKEALGAPRARPEAHPDAGKPHHSARRDRCPEGRSAQGRASWTRERGGAWRAEGRGRAPGRRDHRGAGAGSVWQAARRSRGGERRGHYRPLQQRRGGAGGEPPGLSQNEGGRVRVSPKSPHAARYIDRPSAYYRGFNFPSITYPNSSSYEPLEPGFHDFLIHDSLLVTESSRSVLGKGNSLKMNDSR
jgi:hypothetical protein